MDKNRKWYKSSGEYAISQILCRKLERDILPFNADGYEERKHWNEYKLRKFELHQERMSAKKFGEFIKSPEAKHINDALDMPFEGVPSIDEMVKG